MSRKILVSLFVGAVVFAGLLLFPNQYRSAVSFYVKSGQDTGRLASLVAPDLDARLQSFGAKVDVRDYITSYLGAEVAAREVIEKLGLFESEDFWEGASDETRDLEQALEILHRRVTIKSRLRGPIEVVVETRSPELSQKIAAEYFAIVNARIKEDNRRDLEFWRKELVEQLEHLGKAELTISDTSFDDMMASTSISPEVLKNFLDLISAHGQAEVELGAVEAELDAPSGLEKQLQLVAQRASLTSRIETLGAQISVMKDKISQNPERQIKERKARRDLVSQESLVALFQGQVREAVLEAKKGQSTIILLSEPRVPRKPQPHLMRNIVFALAAVVLCFLLQTLYAQSLISKQSISSGTI